MKRTILAISFIVIFLTASCLIDITPVLASENSWTTKTQMPTARSELGVAVVNGKIYAIGGINADGYLNTNEEYDPATDTWITKTSMPTPRVGFGIAVYQNKIYVIGGGGEFDMEEGTGLNQVYDPLTDTWETKASMPTARQFLCANVVNGRIYLIGGSKPVNLANPSYVPNVNEVYDPETDTWTTKTPPPVNVSNYASAVVDNKIYVISGSGEDDKLTLIYDPEADSWSYGAQIPTPVWGAAAGITTGVLAPKRIYVIGGYPAFNLNQIYDPETDTWTMGARMPTNRYGLGVAVVNDILYAIGGSGDANTKNEQYTPLEYETETQQTEPFPTTWIIAAIAIIAISGVAVLVYFRIIKKTEVTITSKRHCKYCLLVTMFSLQRRHYSLRSLSICSWYA